MQLPFLAAQAVDDFPGETRLGLIDEEKTLAINARRDQSAFGELFHRYITPVYRYLYSHVGDTAEAEDLAAQVFTSAWEGIASYRAQGSFAAWLFAIARNKANQYHRSKHHLLQLSAHDQEIRVDWDPLAALEKREALQQLARLVNQLGAEQRELIRLRFAADLTFVEIAALTGRSEAALKMALHRLLRQLQDQWEK